MADRGTVEIRVTHATNSVAVIKAFRGATNATVSEIRQALTQRTPIASALLYGHDHEEAEVRLLALLNELEGLDAEYEVIIDGEPESRQYLNNILQLWRDTCVETQMMTDLEVGEPDIETLQWLQRESPDDVFRDTLRQIVRGDGYSVDPETLAWARRQLSDA